MPLMAPLLAWLGISGITMVETGRYLETAAVAALALGALLWFRAHRRNRAAPACNSNGHCGCRSER